MTPEIDTEAGTVTDNYIDVKYEHYTEQDEDGQRMRVVDTWYATRPTPPEYSLVDENYEPIPDREAVVETGWTVQKAGLPTWHIFNHSDIRGLRALLDRLETEFDRHAMENLLREEGTEDADSDS